MSKTKEFSGSSASGPANDVLDAATNSGDLKEALEDNFDIGPEEQVRKKLEQTSLNPQDERRDMDLHHRTEVSSVRDRCVRPKQTPIRPTPASASTPASRSQEAEETAHSHQLNPTSGDQEIAVANTGRDLVPRNLLGGNVIEETMTEILQTNPGVCYARQQVAQSQTAPFIDLRNANFDLKDGNFNFVLGSNNVLHHNRAPTPLDNEVVPNNGPVRPEQDLKETYRLLLGSQRKITTDDMQNVYGKFGEGWKELARKLGFCEGDIQTISYRHYYAPDGLKEMGNDMLCDWLENKSNEATISELTAAIIDLKATSSSHKREILDSLHPYDL